MRRNPVPSATMLIRLAIDTYTELQVLPIIDNAAGVAATGTIVITGPATASGTLELMIAGRRVSVGVLSGDTATAIGTAVAAAITAATDMPVTAAAVTGTVTLTCRHKGEAGNSLNARVNYYTGQVLPAGVGVTFTAFTNGAGNPVLTTALAAIGDEWLHTWAVPYTDAASLAAIKTELSSRFAWNREIEAHAFTAARGTQGTLSTLGDSHNSQHLVIMMANDEPMPAYEKAAETMAIAAYYAAIDPARPVQNLPYVWCLAWRDNYRAATFRGVGFFVATADSSHGRRQAVHETAQRDIPYTEDLGRKSREFGITGYLLGKDYDLAREELIKVCEQAGPGVLVHPYRGELTVVCRGLTVSESSEEGGKCTISMTFLEAGEASYPSAKVDSVNAISEKGNEVTEAAKENFVSDFLTKGYPSFVADAATTQIKDLSDFLSSPEFIVSSDIQAVSDYYDKVKSIGSDAFDLIQQPIEFAYQVVDAIGSIRSAFGGSAFKMLMNLYDQYVSSDDDESGTVVSHTPSRQQVVRNSQAVAGLVRQAAISQASTAAVVTQTTEDVSNGGTKTTSVPTKYDSYESAIAVRTELADRLDEESETASNDLVYVTLTDLRTAVVRAVPDPEQDLPRLATFSPRQTLPSLVVAYQLYGDAARADDIVARNDPRRPGFLTGGQQLEVLANG